MGQPKKQTTHRKAGMRRSHHALKLARRVNSKSPVKVYTTKRESGSKNKSQYINFSLLNQRKRVRIKKHGIKSSLRSNRSSANSL